MENQCKKLNIWTELQFVLWSDLAPILLLLFKPKSCQHQWKFFAIMEGGKKNNTLCKAALLPPFPFLAIKC